MLGSRLTVGALRAPGCGRVETPQGSTSSGGRSLYTRQGMKLSHSSSAAAVGVFAALSQNTYWQGWRVSPALQLAQQSGVVLLVFPCWSAPGGPHSHSCCSCYHCLLQQGKAGSSCPKRQFPLFATALYFPSSSPWDIWEHFCPFQHNMLQSCMASALPRYFPTESCAVNILLSMVLALGLNRDKAAWCSWLLDRKAARDRDPMQSNYPNF